MKDILNNSKEYFDNLSKDEFENLLNEFGFKYEYIGDKSNDLKELKRYIHNIKISKFIENSFIFNKTKEIFDHVYEDIYIDSYVKYFVTYEDNFKKYIVDENIYSNNYDEEENILEAA